jgi:hypothetical protein
MSSASASRPRPPPSSLADQALRPSDRLEPSTPSFIEGGSCSRQRPGRSSGGIAWTVTSNPDCERRETPVRRVASRLSLGSARLDKDVSP